MQTWAIRHPELTVGLDLPIHTASNAASDAEQSRRWEKCIDRSLTIRQLEDDWDGQGTPAPPVEVVDSALVLALLLSREGIVAPTGVIQGVNSDVVFDWQSPDGKYIEVEVIGPYTADVFIQSPGLPLKHIRIESEIHERSSGVKGEDEPVTQDESVLRLVWGEFLRPGMAVPILPVAFTPRDDETDGISVFRLACLSEPKDARIVMSPEKRDRYAIAVIPVAGLYGLGLSVLSAKIDTIPDHAVIPELNIRAVNGDRRWWKELQLKLVALAARNLIVPVEPIA